MSKPGPGEYPPYYATYIEPLPETDILDFLEKQAASTSEFLSSISEEKANYRYADDKWSIKEVMGHVSDSERIFAYRALALARMERQSLPGFDQNEYVLHANFDKRSLDDIAKEKQLVRASNLALFRSLEKDAIQRKGMANMKEISVRAILYVIAGHEIHHLNVIREKYLS